MENIGTDYIENAINELVELLGIKKNIDSRPLLNLLRKGDIKGCIKNIALFLGLPIEIDLSYVSEKDIEDRFESSDLVKTDYRGMGTEGIVAQVLIPKDIPFYGNSRLNGYPIKVKVSKNCVDHPETMISVISHELSHILLATIASKYKENEIYTDLTPLILGFSNVVSVGRKTVKVTTDYAPQVTTTNTQTTSYGYLDDKQFDFACAKINKTLEKDVSQKKLLHQKILRFEKIHNLSNKYLNLFKELLVYFHSHKNINLEQKDSERFISFFNVSFFDDINLLNDKNKDRIEKLKKYYSNLEQQTKYNRNVLNKNTDNTLSFIHDLENKTNRIKSDIKILIKYLNLSGKIKACIKYFSIWFTKNI